MIECFAALFAALALIGAGCALLATQAVVRLAATPPHPGPALAATLLKPLRGAEPGLADNLAAALTQRQGAPFELLCAVHDPTDPAAAIAEAAFAAHPHTPAWLLRDPRLHGTNRKVSQLVNMTPFMRHDVVVLTDSDMWVPPGWLAAVTAPLADPRVGLVTCLFRGEPGTPGPWSRLAARGIDWHFLPAAAWGERMGRADGCYGPTIALRRETLERIGGFQALNDLLADDHALGAAVRRLGMHIHLAPVLPVHVMDEPSLAAMLRHELRWARTLRLLAGRGYVGMGVMHALPPAILAAVLAPWGLGVLAAVYAVRLSLVVRVGRALGRWFDPIDLVRLPVRDLLSFGVWVGGLIPGLVTWDGRRYRVHPDGGMAEATETGV